MKAHLFCRSFWWLRNFLLTVALVATIWSGIWEFSVRKYLRGFSDAIIPEASAPQQKAEAILAWMRFGPPRQEVQNLQDLSPRDPSDTLNYRELLKECGSATNAFLNLSRSAGRDSRRLPPLSADGRAKHVVAEIYLDGRWVIVDPTHRAFLKDAQGRLLTARELQDPKVFQEASSQIVAYPPDYTYEQYTHVRLSALPFHGSDVRRILDQVIPGWDEYLDWGLLLEHRSFLYSFLSVNLPVFLMIVRLILGYLADHQLMVPRFHLRANLTRATAAFFSTPEIK